MQSLMESSHPADILILEIQIISTNIIQATNSQFVASTESVLNFGSIQIETILHCFESEVCRDLSSDTFCQIIEVESRFRTGLSGDRISHFRSQLLLSCCLSHF